MVCSTVTVGHSLPTTGTSTVSPLTTVLNCSMAHGDTGFVHMLISTHTSLQNCAELFHGAW